MTMRYCGISMMRWLALGFPTLLLASLLVTAGCSEDTTGPGESKVIYDLYVDVVSGSNNFTGTEEAPLKTITAALVLAEAGDKIKVAPGTYNAAAGEIFPLTPTGVELIGDEAGKGAGDNPTLILGGVTRAARDTPCTMEPGPDTVIAGFSIRNPGPTTAQVYGVVLVSDRVTLRNCSVVGCAEHETFGMDSAVIVAGADSLRIIGNVISNNGEVGLNINWGGDDTVIEYNEFRGNQVGVCFNSTMAVDLGGGEPGSAGGNVISCNSQCDLYWFAPEPSGSIEIQAAGNFWDHLPPTSGYSDGADIGLPGTVTIVIDGAGVATNNCP